MGPRWRGPRPLCYGSAPRASKQAARTGCGRLEAPRAARTPTYIVFSSRRSKPVSKNTVSDIVLISGARTPMAEWIGGKRGDGQPGGALASVSAIDLGAIAARAAIE